MNAINWFEIPVSDFDRAVKFYNRILSANMQVIEMGDAKMAMLPSQMPGVGGALVRQPGHKPGVDGARVYLNGGENLEGTLNRIESAGGKVLVKKTKVTEEIGYWAMFQDSEGNHIALHSPK